MKRPSLPLLLLLGSLTLSSCSLFSSEKEDKKAEEKPAYDPNKPQREATVDELALSGGQSAAQGSQSLSVSTPEELAKIDNQAEGPVFFTDPDNPNAEIEGITEAFEGASERAFWTSHLSKGIRYARSKNMPTLIWFHDSMLSPKSKGMARDLLETPEFLAWMKGRVVGVRLDSSAGFDANGYKTDGGSGSQNILSLRRRYGIKKIPAFVIISPQGERVSTVDASDGFISAASQGIRSGVAQAQKMHRHYLEQLREKGYREWSNSRGTFSVFAKLKKFDRKKDLVYIVEHTGKRRRIKLFDLAAADIEYLEALKQ